MNGILSKALKLPVSLKVVLINTQISHFFSGDLNYALQQLITEFVTIQVKTLTQNSYHNVIFEDFDGASG